MKTIILGESALSLEELLVLAREEEVLIVSEDGERFILEEADDFDREVELLGNSDRFMEFLQERSRQKGRGMSIEAYCEKLAKEKD